VIVVTAGRLGEVIVEAHEGSTLLDAKSALNFVAYGRRRPAGTAIATAVPRWFADTEEVTGSNPCRAHLPAFDAMGFPLTDNGTSTVVPGLFFCGVHFLRKRKSSVLFGVGEDAAIVARSIARHRPQQRTAPPSA
jgi:hypothetical protein